MRKQADSRALLFERIKNSPPKFVHVTGVPYSAELQTDGDGIADRLAITLEAPPFGRLTAVINTHSHLASEAGADPRVRVSVLPDTWTEKPATGLVECDAMNYAALEMMAPISYEEHDRAALSEMLLAKAKSAIRAEVWGDLYATDHLGIRQIHSRRKSSAVAKDLIGRDGALKLFYADENRAELFFFKFHGQP